MSSFEPTASNSAPRIFVPDDAQPRAHGFVSDRAAAGPPQDDGTAAVPEAETTQAVGPPDPAVAEREAYDEGFRAGREALPWREAEQLESTLEALRGAAEAVGNFQRNYLAEHRRLAVELSLTIAERIVGRAVEADPDLLTGLVERAIAGFTETEPLCVKLSERDHAVLEAGSSAGLTRLSESTGLRFESDEALEAGEVRVEGERSQVDARWGELLRRVREELLTALASGVQAS